MFKNRKYIAKKCRRAFKIKSSIFINHNWMSSSWHIFVSERASQCFSKVKCFCDLDIACTFSKLHPCFSLSKSKLYFYYYMLKPKPKCLQPTLNLHTETERSALQQKSLKTDNPACIYLAYPELSGICSRLQYRKQTYQYSRPCAWYQLAACLPWPHSLTVIIQQFM